MAEPSPNSETEVMDPKPDAPDCHRCDTFEPQAWRKSLCRNCFHALEEHVEDLLAAEAKEVAKEAAMGQKKDPGKSSKSSTAVQPASPSPKEAPKPAPKPDMTTSKAKKTSTKDTKDSPHSSTSSSSSSSSSLSGSTASSAPKSAREKFLEKVGKSSEKTSGPGKDSTSSTAAKSEKKATEPNPKTSSSSLPPSSKSLLKSSQQSSTSSASSSSLSSKSKTASSSSISSTTTTTNNSPGQKGSILKATTALMESKMSSSKSSLSQPPKSQEVRIPGASGSSLSSKLSAFAEKTGTSEPIRKTTESKLSSKSSSETSKSTQSSKPASKKEPEPKESNVASKFAKFGGSKLKESPKNSTEDLRSKTSTGAPLKKEGTKNDVPSKSNSSKTAVFEKNSPNKNDSERVASSSLKHSKDFSSSRTDLVKGAGQDKQSSIKKEGTSSKPSAEHEKNSPVGKKTAGLDKSESKNSTKHDGLSTRLVGSTSAKPGENTPLAGAGRWGGKAGGGEKLISSDVTGKHQARSTSEGSHSSPKPNSSSEAVGKEGKEKISGQGSASGGELSRVGAGKSDDKNVVSKDGGDVDPRNKHSPRPPAPQPTDPIRPAGTLDRGEQTAKDPLRGGSKKPSDLSLDITPNGNKSDGSVRSTPSPLTSGVKSILDTKSKFRDKDLHPPKSPNVEVPSPTRGDKLLKHGVDEGSTKISHDGGGKTAESDEQRKLKEELKRREEELQGVKSRLTEMESRVKDLETEKEKALQAEKKERDRKAEDEKKKAKEMEEKNRREEAEQTSHKRDLDTVKEKLIELQAKLEEKEGQCERLTTDNLGLKERLTTRSQEDHEKTEKEKELSVLEQDLEAAEKELEETREDNRELKRQVMEMRNEMDEMTDSFRESELEEFREMQRELEMASKNCRILQFKLRKAERRNIQTEEDRANYEEKLRQLEAQFDSQDARSHIQVLEEELRVAKEVSVRLHDELDIVEDKRLKAMEENRHLTELLEHTDKRQFRMEMEIDKLRDMGTLAEYLLDIDGTLSDVLTGAPKKPPTLSTSFDDWPAKYRYCQKNPLKAHRTLIDLLMCLSNY
ncbi:microtubule cross-linking factor 1 [Elysia marginata]|uniref:Microtubule cross-linking factor 1 n=1 Tax=Elysia marginata TaxID=1093978 RepID=A0AAV4JC30_9GAST|nr:microtubule cross-linking factor 1 [Elysia marginata]